jgi:hypothetical protein
VKALRLTGFLSAAVERVPKVKPKDIDEVFFGNVLSAKYVAMLSSCYLPQRTLSYLFGYLASARLPPGNALSVQGFLRKPYVQL